MGMFYVSCACPILFCALYIPTHGVVVDYHPEHPQPKLCDGYKKRLPAMALKGASGGVATRRGQEQGRST